MVTADSLRVESPDPPDSGLTSRCGVFSNRFWLATTLTTAKKTTYIGQSRGTRVTLHVICLNSSGSDFRSQTTTLRSTSLPPSQSEIVGTLMSISPCLASVKSVKLAARLRYAPLCHAPLYGALGCRFLCEL